jgi:uncharacterized protein
VVDFGAFVDVGLSDSGLVHISQLSAGYVRDPHDVIAVGDQVRVWVATVDHERRRVALTMIPPGTERVKPDRQRKPRRGRPAPQPAAQTAPADTSATPAARTPMPPSRPAKQQQRRGRRDAPRQQPRTGAYEKRAPKVSVPITKAMEEGKEFMRSFGDLLQFHQKKKEKDTTPAESQEAPAPPPAAAHEPSNGSRDDSHESPVMSGEVNESGS